jgi:S-adenosylmethionine-dependent methyltransferase
VGAMVSGSTRMGSRTGVVWAAVRRTLEQPGAYYEEQAQIVDIGGGTGGFAVPLAELGHRVLVVDPNPDALAALARRAAEAGVTDRVTAVQGGVGEVGELVSGADLVLCHEVLEILEDPAAALVTIAHILRPGGSLSLLVAGLHAAVVARAMAGHFQQAITLLDHPADGAGARSGRRFTPAEVTTLLDQAGLVPDAVHAARVFSDLVPGALIDSEPGAAQALADLEQAVSERPEYLALATHLHFMAHHP